MLQMHGYEKIYQWSDNNCAGKFFPRSFYGCVVCVLQQEPEQAKILEWDGDGFWLYFKRLERGCFRWPTEGDCATMLLDVNELSCLIDSARLEKKLSRKEVLERQIS